jgi:hypothetical protein
MRRDPSKTCAKNSALRPSPFCREVVRKVLPTWRNDISLPGASGVEKAVGFERKREKIFLPYRVEPGCLVALLPSFPALAEVKRMAHTLLSGPTQTQA